MPSSGSLLHHGKCSISVELMKTVSTHHSLMLEAPGDAIPESKLTNALDAALLQMHEIMDKVYNHRAGLIRSPRLLDSHD